MDADTYIDDCGATEMYELLPGITVTSVVSGSEDFANGDLMSCEFKIKNEVTFPASGFIKIRIPDEIEIVNPLDRKSFYFN